MTSNGNSSKEPQPPPPKSHDWPTDITNVRIISTGGHRQVHAAFLPPQVVKGRHTNPNTAEKDRLYLEFRTEKPAHKGFTMVLATRDDVMDDERTEYTFPGEIPPESSILTPNEMVWFLVLYNVQDKLVFMRGFTTVNWAIGITQDTPYHVAAPMIMALLPGMAITVLGMIQDLGLDNIPSKMWCEDEHENPFRLRPMRAANLCVDEPTGSGIDKDSEMPDANPNGH